jgi:hypothetical protein
VLRCGAEGPSMGRTRPPFWLRRRTISSASSSSTSHGGADFLLQGGRQRCDVERHRLVHAQIRDGGGEEHAHAGVLVGAHDRVGLVEVETRTAEVVVQHRRHAAREHLHRAECDHAVPGVGGQIERALDGGLVGEPRLEGQRVAHGALQDLLDVAVAVDEAGDDDAIATVDDIGAVGPGAGIVRTHQCDPIALDADVARVPHRARGVTRDDAAAAEQHRPALGVGHGAQSPSARTRSPYGCT